MGFLILSSATLLLCISPGISLPTWLSELTGSKISYISSAHDVPLQIKERDTNKQFSVADFQALMNIREFMQKSSHAVPSSAVCMSCKFGVAFLQGFVHNGATEQDIAALVNGICTFFRIEPPNVCAGVSKLYKKEITMVLAKTNASAGEICRFLFQGCGPTTNPLYNWTVPLPPFPKPPVKSPSPPKPGSPVYRVLHITDVHVDPHYANGSNAQCADPMCCRLTSGKLRDPTHAAGYWGDYRNCDIPFRTLEAMLIHINKTHKLDYVLWTGDIPPHDTWNTTRSKVVRILHEVSQAVYKHLGAIPIFPAVGNHESAPVNSFPIPQIKGNDSIDWLYKEIVKAWGSWLPGNNDTLRLGAFYSVPVDPGLRVISLNMNYCYSLNWWLLINSSDPTGQLAWLTVQLQMAELKGEKVHIIGHVPSGYSTCVGVWSSNYYRIINRYENTVTAQFFAHAHTDQFEIFYDNKAKANPRSTSISYIAPSATTFRGLNPSYRIYTVDGNYNGSSKVVLDHETYVANLTEANLNEKLNWKLEYSAKNAYNMTSLLPSEWHRLTERFEDDDDLFQKFLRFYYTMSDYRYSHCNKICKKKFICKLRRGESSDPPIC